MTMKARDYAKILSRTGTLPKEAIWDLIGQLELIEYEVGLSREFITSAATVDYEPTQYTEPIRSFVDRIVRVGSDYETYVDYPQPPDHYIKESLVHKMEDELWRGVKFSETFSFAHGLRTRVLRAKLMILMPRREDGKPYTEPASPKEAIYSDGEEDG